MLFVIHFFSQNKKPHKSKLWDKTSCYTWSHF